MEALFISLLDMKIVKPFFLLRLSLSVLLGTAIFLILPLNHYPKVVNVVSSEIIIEETMLYFVDMDDDGRDEVVMGFIMNNLFGLHIKSFSGGPKQHNIICDIENIKPVFYIGDYNDNGQKEIYCIYNIGDSIFMDIIFSDDPEKSGRYKKIFIDSLKSAPDNIHRFQLQGMLSADLNGDSYKEVILSLAGVYETYYPRKIVAYDLVNDSLISSPPLNNIIREMVIFDHEGDGKIEITGTCGAPDNNKETHEDYLLHDQSAWLMVFDSELNLINGPPEFPGINTAVSTVPKMIDGKTELAGYCRHFYRESDHDYLFYTRNLNEVIVTDTIPKPDGLPGFLWYPLTGGQDSSFIGLRADKHLVFINSDLRITRLVELSAISILDEPVDLCDNNDPEILTKEKASNIFRIYNTKGKLLTEFLLENKQADIGWIGLTNFTGQVTAYRAAGNSIIFFTIENNIWFYLRWLVLLSVIVILHSFSWISMYLQQRQSSQKIALTNKMRKLELASINSRLDPHFTFNALNVLRFLADKNDHQGVEKFVMHFSRLLRQHLQSSDKPAHKLSDELTLVNHYIQLQKLRYEIPIEIDQQIDTDVDQTLLIPKNLIHTHIENAIKHGLLPAPGGGTIKLNISVANHKTIISIRNNGVGRNPDGPAKFENGHGKGLQILEELADLFYKLHKVHISQEIIDHENGTEVVIRIG